MLQELNGFDHCACAAKSTGLQEDVIRMRVNLHSMLFGGASLVRISLSNNVFDG